MELQNSLNQIKNKQIEFQKLVGFPVDSIIEQEICKLGELYIFKAIEELIELRKEFPSSMNPWSKDQKTSDRDRILEEFADVSLFLINFANVWKLSNEEILETISRVQELNFLNLKIKKLEELNHEILKNPEISSPGVGNINPSYIFIGQNPGQALKRGDIAWGEPLQNSAKVLRSILKELNVDDVSYFTNYVKSPTQNNQEPSIELAHYWEKYLDRELEILTINNPNPKIITMGRWVNEKMPGFNSIYHPAFVLRTNYDLEKYKQQIRQVL
jgi:NTP pyrophosphatase (non-canonical NTP hydrolase)